MITRESIRPYVYTLFSDIIVGEYAVVGTGSTLLPGAVLPDGVAVGAMSMVKSSLEEWGIYAGVPCRKLAERSKKCVTLAQELQKE